MEARGAGGAALTADATTTPLIPSFPSLLLPMASDPFFAAAAQWAALGMAAYALLFFLSSKLSPRFFARAWGGLSAADRADWNSRVPSTLHAVASVVWAGALIFGGAFSGVGDGGEEAASTTKRRFGGPTAGAEPEGWSSLRACEGSYAALGLSAGYFAADAVAMLLYPAIGSFPIYAHHAVAIASLVAAGTARAAHAPVLAVLASEATTPLVNARFWLDRCGHRRGFLYAANGLALALAWFLAREVAFVGYFWWMVGAWPGVVAARLPLYARAMLAGVPALLTVLNTLWFFKILKGAQKLWEPFCEGLAVGARRWGVVRGGGKRRAPRGLGGSGGGVVHASATITTARVGGEDGAKALRHHHHHHTRVDVVAAVE